MALSPQQQHRALRALVAQLYPEGHDACPFTKPQLVAAIAATDAWIDANAAAYVAALPAAVRNSTTTEQKAALFVAVVEARG